MDQEYERSLLKQINHQNLPVGQLAKVSKAISCISGIKNRIAGKRIGERTETDVFG